MFWFPIPILTPKASAEESHQPQVTETAPQTRRQLEDTRKGLTDAKETTRSLDPLVQPLVSAVSTVDVTIKTTKDVNFHSFDRGGYAAMATALGPILVTRGGDCSGKPSGAGEATFHGIFGEMTGASATGKPSAMGKPIADLRSANFIQIEFAPMEENPVVIRGHVTFTLNNSRQLHFEIPPQTGVWKKNLRSRSFARNEGLRSRSHAIKYTYRCIQAALVGSGCIHELCEVPELSY